VSLADVLLTAAVAMARTPRTAESHGFRLEGRYGITFNEIFCLTGAIAADRSYPCQNTCLRDFFLDGVDDVSTPAPYASHALTRNQLAAWRLDDPCVFSDPSTAAVDVLSGNLGLDWHVAGWKVVGELGVFWLRRSSNDSRLLATSKEM
jgi:hypothetical protein